MDLFQEIRRNTKMDGDVINRIVKDGMVDGWWLMVVFSHFRKRTWGFHRSCIIQSIFTFWSLNKCWLILKYCNHQPSSMIIHIQSHIEQSISEVVTKCWLGPGFLVLGYHLVMLARDRSHCRLNLSARFPWNYSIAMLDASRMIPVVWLHSSHFEQEK